MSRVYAFVAVDPSTGACEVEMQGSWEVTASRSRLTPEIEDELRDRLPPELREIALRAA